MISRGRIRRLSFICASAAVLLCGACASKEQPKLYTLRGTVLKLDRDTNVATIKGDEIPGWMGAMTMEYPVRDRSEYQGLHAGENITATVNVTSDGYWLTNVREKNNE